MGIYNNFLKVMPFGYRNPSITVASLVLLSSLFSISIALQCPPGVQYWDSALDNCQNCTKCGDLQPAGQVVIRPCELHRDTLCGPISELRLDWSWLPSRQHKSESKTNKQHNHRHHHHHRHEQNEGDELDNHDLLQPHEEHSEHLNNRNKKYHHRHHHRPDDKRDYDSAIRHIQNDTDDYGEKNHHSQKSSLIEANKKVLVESSEKQRHRSQQRVIWRFANTATEDAHLHNDNLKQTTENDKSEDSMEEEEHETEDGEIVHSDTSDKVRSSDYSMNENRNNLVRPTLGLTDMTYNDADEHENGNVVNEKLVWPRPTDDAPFSSVETLVWDWQAIVLAMAVCACILFFVVAAAYSVHHARQWKRLKENFEADVEELSARLNLMVNSGDINETLEPNLSPIHDGNYHNNQCVYLEQLLVKKDSKTNSKRVANVYIEDKNSTTTNIPANDKIISND